MRPEIPADLAGDVDDRVRSEVRVPPDRLTFADRVRILVEEYDASVDRADHLEARVEDLEAALDEARDRIEELEDEVPTSSPTATGTTLNSPDKW